MPLPESKFHKRLKRKAVGSKGQIEKKIRGDGKDGVNPYD